MDDDQLLTLVEDSLLNNVNEKPSYSNLSFKSMNRHCELLQELIPLTTVTYLDLSCNSIDAKGMKAIAEGLKRNTSIKVLDLGSNILMDEGLIELCSALEANTTLQALSLPCNTIGDRGVKALCQTLKASNKTLKMVDLRANYISNAALDDIVAMLKVNPSITELNVNKNDLSLDHMRTLVEMVRSGKYSIHSLGGNGPSLEALGCNLM